MDPFTHNLLGAIRQREILEEAEKGRQGAREWRWKYLETMLEERQRIEDAGAWAFRDVSLRSRFRSLLSLLKRWRGVRLATQAATGQGFTDTQCVEC